MNDGVYSKNRKRSEEQIIIKVYVHCVKDLRNKRDFVWVEIGA